MKKKRKTAKLPFAKDTGIVVVRTAGFVRPSRLIQFKTDSKGACGDIENGLSMYFDGDINGGVIDFDDLCRVVDAARRHRGIKP